MGNTRAEQKRPASRRLTNATLEANPISAARQLGINISAACETGLREPAVQLGANAGWK
jgi:post-segregation antitoxin (ccd killing protein)